MTTHNTMPPSAPTGAATPTGLDDWPRGQPAVVAAVQEPTTAQDRDVLLRLVEIGFLPGEPVQVVARGFPSGDPIAVRVGGTTFALRRHEAALVRVTGADAGVSA